jgi:hypothetical protein
MNRIAYREFTKNPDLSLEEFWALLGRELFGEASTPQLIDDAVEIQRAFTRDRTWCQASPLVEPERVRALKNAGQLDAKRRTELRSAVERLRAIADRHREASSVGAKELQRIAAWVVSLWSGKNASLLDDSAP